MVPAEFLAASLRCLTGNFTGGNLYFKMCWSCFQIPAGCQADQIIRLQGKGIRRINSYSYGDHYVHIKIKVPK